MNSGRPAHALSPDAALSSVRATRDGLTSAEVDARRERHGKNVIERGDDVDAWRILARQFRSLVVSILIGAAALSFVTRAWVDGAAILSIVVLNAAFGFRQEYSAERALAALRDLTAPRARVRRDGASCVITAADVVPGDVIEIEAGDVMSADARLLAASGLHCGEAALTGEAAPVAKNVDVVLADDTPLAERVNLVFLGTAVTSGRASAVVTATGMRTEMGRIAALLGKVRRTGETPLERRLAAVGRLLVVAALAIVALLFFVGIVRGLPFLDVLFTSIGLAVAAVPEGLPSVVTIALAVGVQRMATRRALVRRLHAVETLGQASVICSDKTGTLTVGTMTVRELWTIASRFDVDGEGYAPVGAIRPGGDGPVGRGGLAELLTVIAGCNGAVLRQERGTWEAVGDPTEAALLAAAAKGGVTVASIDRAMPRIAELPFDPTRKRMTMVRQCGSGRRALVKGAPDHLIDRCASVFGPGDAVRPITPSDRERIEEALRAMSDRGLRILAGAWRDLPAGMEVVDAERVERDLVFAGLAGMQDPPKPEARAAVARAREAGIHVTMITGDHPKTAITIAREIGLGTPGPAGVRAITGPEIDRTSDEELTKLAAETVVFARVSPEHKLRIVRAYQARGDVVAMTGDGVNDAPAIRGADIGIAMGRTGTEVAKGAADMVVTDDDFASIVAAVEEGRGIYANIRKTLQYLLAGNCGELLFMTACITAGLPIPLTPLQLLWINLVTDGLPALCLATDPPDPDVMKRRPRSRAEEMTDRGFLSAMALTGLLTASIAFVAYVAALRVESEVTARAHAFTVLVIAELLRSFGARSETRAAWNVGLTTNLRLTAVVLASVAFQLAAPHVGFLGSLLALPDMTLRECSWLFAAGAVPLVVLEALKVFRRRSSRATARALA